MKRNAMIQSSYYYRVYNANQTTCSKTIEIYNLYDKNPNMQRVLW